MNKPKLYRRPQVKLAERHIKESSIWADDLFHRSECAKMLTDLMTDGEDSLVVAVNGSWGSGKSFFLRRWYNELIQTNSVAGKTDAGCAIYYNAWEDDFFEDPFIPLLVQLRKPFDLAGSGDSLWKSIVDNAKVIARESSVSIVNGLIKKVADVDFTALKRECVQTVTEDALETYEKMTASRKAIRDGLAKLALDRFVRTGHYTVLIIDELDRCSPVFAVKLLERIKHIFSVPYLLFVLGIDKEQFSHTLQKFYGMIDVDNYLHRFIDVDFSLPEPNTTAYLNSLWKAYGIESYYQSVDVRKCILTPLRRARKILAYFGRMHSLSLREIETVFKRFVLIFRTKVDPRRLHPEFVAGLIMLKFLNPKIYERWISGRLQVVDAIDTLMPVPDVRNFPEAESVAAAFYAVHNGQVAQVAAATNTFLNLARKGACRASEIKVAVPRFMGGYSAKKLKEFAGKVTKAKTGSGGRNGCTAVEMSYIAKRIDFVAGDFGNHVGLPDGVAIA